jgi:hypothetical protein
MFSPLAPKQAANIIAGKGRVYVLMWMGWVGKDGARVEKERCFFLKQPPKHITQPQWQECFPPPFMQP